VYTINVALISGPSERRRAKDQGGLRPAIRGPAAGLPKFGGLSGSSQQQLRNSLARGMEKETNQTK